MRVHTEAFLFLFFLLHNLPLIWVMTSDRNGHRFLSFLTVFSVEPLPPLLVV